MGYRKPSNPVVRFVWPSGTEKEISRQEVYNIFGTSDVEKLNSGIDLKRPLWGRCRAEKVTDDGKLLHAASVTPEGEKWAEVKNLLLTSSEDYTNVLPPNVLKLVARLRGGNNGQK